MEDLLTWDLVFKVSVGAYVLGTGSIKLMRALGVPIPSTGEGREGGGAEGERRRRQRAEADHDAVTKLITQVDALEREMKEVKDVVDRVEQRQYDQHRMMFFPRSGGPPDEGGEGGRTR